MRIGSRFAITALAAWVSGCATVDPRPDYERVRSTAAAAVGAVDLYQPDEEALVRERTDGLLADGMDVAESVQIALLNNPRFQAAMMRVGIARADLVQSSLWSNPVVGIGARLPSGGGLVNLEASLAQSLSELWQIRPRREIARADLDTAILEVAREAVELVARTKSAYYETVGARELLATARENLENVRRIHEAVIARRDAGAGTELDVNLALDLVLEAELSELSHQLAAGESARKLAGLLGLTGRAEALVLSQGLPSAAVSDDSLRLDSQRYADALVDAARQHRLDHRVAREQVAAAARRVGHEVRRVLPAFELGVDFEREARRRSNTESRDRESESDRDQQYIVGPTIGLEIPIFDQNQAQIARARFELARARKGLDAIERAMLQEVYGAAQRTVTAWRLVELFKTRSLPLAERNLELARDSYELGRASFLTVLEAQRSRLQAHTRYIESLTAAAKTEPLLEMAIGLPLSQLAALNDDPEANAQPSGSADPARPAREQ